MQACLSLKKNKDRPIRQRHHWIYSGAIHSFPEGNVAEVFSFEGEKLGTALLNKGHSIAAHMIAFGEESIEEALHSRIVTALAMRRTIFDPKQTNGFRLIHAEGDGIPGLIVDCYGDVLVLQIAHPGLETLKETIIDLLNQLVKPRAIYEKSTSFLRKKEGLQERKGFCLGTSGEEVEILENGMKLSVNIVEGQKTGFFLDQREMRSCVRDLSYGKRVLNGFAYTGGFTVAALAGGASLVDSVEVSGRCEQAVAKNIKLNGLDISKHRFFQVDMFDFLKQNELNYDLVILDPPEFVKKRDDINQAFRAYKELNRQAMAKMASYSILLSCSCSYHVDETLFQNILFRAALEANKRIKIIGGHRLAFDHPVSLFHPESSYLKSFLLYID